MISYKKYFNTKSDYIKYFTELLHENYDDFFTIGNTDLDYKHITDVIKRQGYYSGVYKRYYFNEDLECIDIQDKF